MATRQRGRLVKLLSWGVFAGLIQGACGGSDEEKLKAAGLTAGCVLNSDCADPLVCAFERCHNACLKDKDCPRAERCVKAFEGLGVCQLPDETRCSADQDCHGSQECGVDKECREPCTQSTDCWVGQICANSGECASTDPTKDRVDSDGNIQSGAGGADGGTGDGGVPSTGGATDAGGAGGTSAGGTSAGGTSTGGTSMGGSAGTSDGGTSSGAGGDAASGAGGSSQGGAGGSPFDYVESSDGVEAVDNYDRDHAPPAQSTASIFLPDGDEDWFSLQAPDDGRAHVITVDFKQTPGLRTEVHAMAAADFSSIGSAVLDSGITTAIHLSVGPGSTTLLQLFGYASTTGRAELAFTMTAEEDVNEPNNDCDSATPISLNTDVTAEFIVPYTSDTDRAPDDWYKLDLAQVPTILNLLSVPANGRFVISRVNSSGVVASMTTTNTGEHSPVSFTPAAAGPFCIHFAPYAASFPDFASGVMPSNMSTPYVFRIEQP